MSLATAVEFITATLHDDVIDESALRRGKDTANMLWGNDASVLVGDFLFARAFELMVEAGDIAVLGRLANASASITQGEIKQLEITGTPDTSEEEYIEVISGKTAVLFAAAAAAGASISGAPEKQVAAMHDYGMQLGLAFQIMDDAMDYTVSSTKMGKNSGDDFFERKITLPFILAWQEGSSKERAFWSRTIGEGDFIDGDLKKAQNIIEKHHAIDQSVKIAGGYAQAAISALDPLRSRDEISLQLTGALTSTALFAASRQN